jgi:hypothetical protein
MNPEDAEPLDDTLLSLAASCDEALADGRAPDLQQTAQVPEEYRSDLGGRIDCMRLLRAWAGDSGATPGEARPSEAPTATGTEPSLSERLRRPTTPSKPHADSATGACLGRWFGPLDASQIGPLTPVTNEPAAYAAFSKCK